MPETPQVAKSPKSLGGYLQFFFGGIFSSSFFALVVGVPALVGARIGESTVNGNPLFVALAAAAIGIVLSALLGRYIGEGTRAGWPLIAGAELGPIYVFFRALTGSSPTTFELALGGAYAVSGAALAFAYWYGRGKRDIPPVSGREAEALSEASV
ncbi:MAG: hypothetical protein FD171_1395 [Actinobacteria bacterium]|nr:MAG: hypothetical protein FD171_1395 [Actinomycetota bacterium]